MRYIATILFGLLFAGSVAASHCPSLVAKIDSQLASTELDSETENSIKSLRDKGQTLHQQGKHEQSVSVLEEALSKFPDE